MSVHDRPSLVAKAITILSGWHASLVLMPNMSQTNYNVAGIIEKRRVYFICLNKEGTLNSLNILGASKIGASIWNLHAALFRYNVISCSSYTSNYSKLLSIMSSPCHQEVSGNKKVRSFRKGVARFHIHSERGLHLRLINLYLNTGNGRAGETRSKVTLPCSEAVASSD